MGKLLILRGSNRDATEQSTASSSSGHAHVEDVAHELGDRVEMRLLLSCVRGATRVQAAQGASMISRWRALPLQSPLAGTI